MKATALVFIAMGIALLVVGINMRSAKNTWDETTTTEERVPGTKGRNATIGAGLGAVGGGFLAAVVGGIGVVVAGTGIGLPAGGALIAAAATIGAGTGAVAGASTGTSSTIHTGTITITRAVPAYETWQWVAVVAIAAVLFLLAVFEMGKLNPSARSGDHEVRA